MSGVASASGSGPGRRRDEVTFDRLHKFWNDLPPRARQELLKLDKQTLIEEARKNLYCSRCNGLLLECFTQIVMYGKSVQQKASDIDGLSTTAASRARQVEQDGLQDLSVHSWGGLSTTKDDIITLLDCFIKAKSLRVLQNVFDSARAREREREMLYPDACGAGGRGWISQGMASYSKGYGTREMCSLHTAHPSCDTLVNFWSGLSEETRSCILRMKEEDFIEKLTHRFDRKKFCRDCRRNVIREFKELKELKRMRREPGCTSSFCLADNGFQCEVFDDAVIVDWRQCLSEAGGSYHHFEWAIGTDEGKSDVFGFKDVGMNAKIHIKGIKLDQFEDYFITLRAYKLDGHYTEFCVKAQALKVRSCVPHRVGVGDGFVKLAISKSIKSFFEHAEEAEEDDEDVAKDRDGNDPNGDGSHPQKHAKSPELAREFLLNAAAIIFKEQVEKAFRENTARQNAHTVFVSLALKLLEERVHVACKEIITMEKQNKLLEEEEKEKREEEERKMKRRTKEREKKLRRREKLKEKGKDKGKRLVESKSPYRISSSALSNSSASTNDESTNTLDSRDSASEEEDNALVVDLCSPDRCIDQFSCRDINGENNVSSDCCISKQSKSLKQSPRLRKDFLQDESCWYDDSKDEPQWQLKERTRNRARRCHSISSANYGRDRHEYNSCNCDHQEDYRVTGSCFLSTAVSGREMKMARKAGVEKPRVQYRGCYTLDSFIVPNGCHVGSTQKNAIPKEAWETLDAPKKTSLDKTDNASGSVDNVDLLKPVDCDTSGCEKLGVGCEPVPLASESSGNLYKSETYQPCGELSKAASCEETLMMNKQDCNSTNDEGSRLMTNSTCSDSSSSCKREGDRESSSSSMTSSSTQNPESSSSESEESPNSTLYTTSLRTASCSLLETCARNGFREYRPKATRLAQNDRFGFNVSPFQGQLLHHPNMHVPPHSSAIMGLRNHSWAAPTDGNSSPRVLGVPGKQSVYPVRCVASVFGHIRPEPIHEAAASFRAIPPSPPCQNGTQHIAGHPHTDMNTKMHPSDLKPLSQKDPPEDKNTSQDTDAPFSLFQFNLPIVSPAPPSSKYDKTGELAARTPLAQVQAQLCSKEQTDVKEYNLFSTKDSGISFSFM